MKIPRSRPENRKIKEDILKRKSDRDKNRSGSTRYVSLHVLFVKRLFFFKTGSLW